MERLKYIYFRFSKGDLTGRRTFTGTIANTHTDSEIRIKSTGLVRERGRDMTHSYDKSPKEKPKKATSQVHNTKTPPKTLITRTTIADRLRTVSWGNDSHTTALVKPVFGSPTFSLTAKDV